MQFSREFLPIFKIISRNLKENFTTFKRISLNALQYLTRLRLHFEKLTISTPILKQTTITFFFKN